MAKVWTATIQEGRPKMSPYSRADFIEWCKENEGKTVRMEPIKKPVSAEMRAYYFAAVIPAVRSTCEEWKHLSQSQMHDVIKKMFFYFETWNPITERLERFGRSVMSDSDWNNTVKAMEFLEIISQYLADCGLEMPDPEEYKAVRDGVYDKHAPIEYPKNDGIKPAF